MAVFVPAHLLTVTNQHSFPAMSLDSCYILPEVTTTKCSHWCLLSLAILTRTSYCEVNCKAVTLMNECVVHVVCVCVCMRARVRMCTCIQQLVYPMPH